MSILSIQTKAARLEQTQQQIENYRKQWTGGMKAKLRTRLEEINTKCMPSYWYVTEQSGEANRESVFLAMPRVPSGVYDKETNSAYLRQAGYLQFAQLLSGQIAVIVCYPYVEELTTRKEPEILKTLPPNELTDEAIDGLVETFITKIDEWFRGGEQSVEPIGFKPQQPPII